MRSGQDFPSEKYSSNPGGTLYLTGASNLDGEKILENRGTKTPSVIAPFGSLLLVCKGSGVGKMCMMNLPEAHIARQLQAIIPISQDIDIRIIQIALECRIQEITQKANGVIPGIAREAVLSFLLPIPPLNEQERILDKVLKLSPLVERYREKQQTLEILNCDIRERLKKSILQEAIQGKLVPQDPTDEPASILLERIRVDKQKLLKEGKLKKKDLVDSVIFRGEDNKYYEKVGGMILDISEEISFEIPNSWQWVRLGTLFSHNTGKALNRADTDGIKKKYLTTSNVYWNRFDFNEVREMFFTDPELEKCTVHKGDLLVCEGGDIGRSAIWQYDEEICIQNHIHRLRAYYPINTEFYYLVFYHYKNIGNIGGKGIGIQGLSSGALHRLIVPLPPIEEQYRITHKYNSLIASIMRKSTAEVLK